MRPALIIAGALVAVGGAFYLLSLANPKVPSHVEREIQRRFDVTTAQMLQEVGPMPSDRAGRMEWGLVHSCANFTSRPISKCRAIIQEWNQETRAERIFRQAYDQWRDEDELRLGASRWQRDARRD